MTIFGITGIISWSFIKETNQSLPQRTISVFAISFKVALCIVSLIILIIPLQAIHITTVLFIGNGSMPGSIYNPEFWWRESDWYAYLISYALVVLFGIPLISLSLASVYTWSLRPFYLFWHSVRNRS